MTAMTQNTMNMSGETATKRPRSSKNRKKGWRKHSHVHDVEEYLEDKRLQERTGGVAAEKSDEQLFFVERGVDQEEPEQPVSKRKKLAGKPLKIDVIHLSSSSTIKPARVINDVRKAERTTRKRSIRVRELQEKGHVTKTQLQAEKQRKDGAKVRVVKRRTRNAAPQATFDLWGSEDINKPTEQPDDGGHYIKVTRQLRRKVPEKYHEKPSGVDAVEVPHPGASYNPEFFDHQELLGKALEVEEKKLKEEERIYRALDGMFPKQGEAPTESCYMKEMSEGLGGEAESSDSDGEEADQLSHNPPVRREDKKTEKQRKKEAERKQQEMQRLDGKKRTIKKKELFRLKSIKTEVRDRVKDLEERAKQKQMVKEKNKDKPKTLGKVKYEEPDLELKLSQELVGSLRLVKPEGHLLKDRYKSLQKRNIIEARNKAKSTRKYKRKTFEKKSYKEVTL